MRIVLLGSPGAGKGTQAKRLSETHRVAHIASGDIFLRNIREETELGKLAKPYYESGRLVPDELTLGMVVAAIRKAEGGFVLDGFPRNAVQAEILEQELEAAGRPLQAALALLIDGETAVKRIAGRRTCLNDEKHVFNVYFSPPREKGTCDVCGGTLVQRPDQTEEAVRKRFEVYKEQTAPLQKFYSDRGLLREVGASGTEDDVAGRVQVALADLGGGTRPEQSSPGTRKRADPPPPDDGAAP
ncbi:MAG TPA: adenylate kinase [Actinomycetota bacterium]|nr:adenylate kinase [Actinomycetota bacterium]